MTPIMAEESLTYVMTVMMTSRQKTAWAIWEERNDAALKIQTHYWRWRSYKHFIILHETRHINGPLADIYLDRPRKGVRFYINPKVGIR